jgi:sugar phosphate isomerase/epimerase
MCMRVIGSRGSISTACWARARCPFAPCCQILHAHGYSGYLSIEDGQPEGDEGFRRSLAFLQGLVNEVYGA